MAYKRIMLKLSGEVLAEEGGHGVHQETLVEVAKSLYEVAQQGIEVAVVVGGGNIWRYRDNQESKIERVTSDYIGMLATIMNGVSLQAALESVGCFSRVCSAINVPQLAEPYLRRRALRHLEKGRVVIFAGGTGNPYFTTDSAAALRACELNCDILLKATKVDGIYDKDPEKHSDAVRYDELTYQEALEQHIRVMDQAAFSLCEEKKLPIRVFDFFTEGNLLRASKGEDVGTLVHE